MTTQIIPNVTVEYTTDNQKITIKRFVHTLNIIPDILEIPESITIKRKKHTIAIIENGAFENINITKLQLPSTVFSIKDNAFANCYLLEEANLSETKIKLIPFGLFANCTMLQRILLPKSLVAIGNFAFANTNIPDIFIPPTVQHIKGGAFLNCQRLDNISIHKDNQYFVVIGPSIYSKNENELVFANIKEKQYEISDKVTTIGSNAFSGSPITEITIPLNTRKICAEAFSDCKDLRSIKIGSSVQEIQRKAFSGLNLDYISLPSSVEVIGEYLFDSSNIRIIDLHETIVTLLPSHLLNKVSQLEELWLPLTITEYKQDFISNTIPAKIYYCGRLAFSNSAIPKGTKLVCDKPRNLEL